MEPELNFVAPSGNRPESGQPRKVIGMYGAIVQDDKGTRGAILFDVRSPPK